MKNGQWAVIHGPPSEMLAGSHRKNTALTFQLDEALCVVGFRYFPLAHRNQIHSYKCSWLRPWTIWWQELWYMHIPIICMTEASLFNPNASPSLSAKPRILLIPSPTLREYWEVKMQRAKTLWKVSKNPVKSIKSTEACQTQYSMIIMHT